MPAKPHSLRDAC